MKELVIKEHDFEEAKLAIKEFSEQTITDLELKKVNERKGIGEWFGNVLLGGGLGRSHKVTGEEFNDLTVQIQSLIRSINTTQIKLIKQFGQVYTALDSLDKDYIHAILISIKATEQTSERIELTQEQIKKIVEDQKKTLEVLKKFKQKLDSYDHLGDIDEIWNECQKYHAVISAVSNSVSSAVTKSSENAKAICSIRKSIEDTERKYNQLSEAVTEQIARFESIFTFMNELKNIIHLKDIDALWNTTKDNSEKLASLTKQSNNIVESIKKNKSDIAELNLYRQELSAIVHLKDVDSLWNVYGQYSSQIEKLQNQGEELKWLIQHNKELVDQYISADKENTEAILQRLNKKIQYAYWIAGSSVVLALIALFVILLG